MGHWLKSQLEELKADVKLIDIGTQELEGETIPLPPVVFAQIGNDSNKKTLTIYGCVL